MSRIPVQQENAHHAPSSQHTKQQSSSPTKPHKSSHHNKLPLSPIHFHPNLPHSTTPKHTSPVRERPQLRRRRPHMADTAGVGGVKAGHARVSSVDRATEVLSQLHFDYSKTKPATSREQSGRAERAAASSPLSLEQRYEQWKRFWQSIDTTSAHGQQAHGGDDIDKSAVDVDTERLLRWLAFSRQQMHAKQTNSTQHRTAAEQSASDDSQPSSTASSTRSPSPHSPTYYVNLARFLSTAPTHRQRLASRQTTHTAHTKLAKPHQQQTDERTQEQGGGEERLEAEEHKESDVEAGERVEIVIDCNDDQHVAQRYKHKPVPTTVHTSATNEPTSQPAASHPATAASSSGAASSPPSSRTSSAYSFTNLPREHIRPAASSTAKAAAGSSFSLHSYFARMSVPQLQRYLAVFNPSLLSSSLALTKDQLISLCCTFYRTRIAAHRSQPPDQPSDQVKQEAAREAIVVHTNRTYAHLSLPALLHTITTATTLASAPAVLSGVGYVDERSVKSGYRRCMLRVHPDKHTLSGWEEQTRCVELFRLVQNKYADWQRVNGQR